MKKRRASFESHRPAKLVVPEYLSPNIPVPTAQAMDNDGWEEDERTRYGDWTKNGVAIDF